ncbi:flavodoxin family protein [Vibrio rotiferianus]|uniref:flavodoxin family protein n=1 Tax=Vibrio rotiferianus TaxID=190895 RepID=UPI001110C10F|nr:flavodoxin family protein [Vibrio rotiferianus]TMX61670.1 flavodoxin [Vibrio rotiferianus]
MPKVAIVYFTNTNITGQLAQAVAAGVESQAINVVSYRILGTDIITGRYQNSDLFQSIAQCDAIIFGSPTYMGSVAAQFKAFADASSEYWGEQGWSGKVATGFTSGGALNGDQSTTLQYLLTLASQHGMIWVGLDSAHGFADKGINRLGTQLGVVSKAEDGQLHEVDAATARYLGHRVAHLVKRLAHPE